MAIYQVDNTINQIPLKNGYVYCISSIHNIKSILEHGFRTPKKLQTQFAQLINNKPLDEYICFYFNPRNSLLYSRQKTYGDDIVILEIKKDVLLLNNVIFTNKSVKASNFCFADDIDDLLNSSFINWNEVFATSWNDANENVKNEKKFKMMAEVLVPDKVPSAMIAGIVCQNPSAREKVTRILNNNSINISWNSSLFFNDSSDTTANQKREFKYHPQTKDELQALVDDENIYLGDIDTSAITDMSELFVKGYDEYAEIIINERENFDGIELWDVSNVTNMSEMFRGCENFNQALNSWDVSNVTNMGGMFRGCKNFNRPLNAWNVSNVTNMGGMFRGGMFSGCKNFNQPLNAWNVSNVTNMSGMFDGCENFNQPLNSWNVSNVTDMSGMFSGCENFNQALNSWDVSNVTDMDSMFYGCENFNQPICNWNTNEVSLLSTEANINCIFVLKDNKYYPQTKKGLKTLIDNMDIFLGDIDTSAITDMSKLFVKGYDRDDEIIINERENFDGTELWNVSNVTDMSSMFSGCKNFNQALNSWNVSNVTDMSYIFLCCKNFNQALNSWNVSNVTDMSDMFLGCGIDKKNLPKKRG